MSIRTQSFLLLLFGGSLIRLSSGDALLRYVRPYARPLVLVAGAAMVILAIVRLVQAHRVGQADRSAVRTGWLLLAPVIAVLLIAPPALGAFTVRREPPSPPPKPDSQFAALTGSSPHHVGLFEFSARVVWDSARTVTDQDVVLTGFVGQQLPDGFVLARLVITCCAADARPVVVHVHTSTHPAVDQWVQITGRYAGLDAANRDVPIVAAIEVNPIPSPSNPYD